MASSTITPVQYDAESFIHTHFSTSAAIAEACAESRSHQAFYDTLMQVGKIYNSPKQNAFTFVATRLKYIESGAIAFFDTIYNVFVASLYLVVSLVTCFNSTAWFATKKHCAKAVQAIALIGANSAGIIKPEWSADVYSKVVEWTDKYAFKAFAKKELETLAKTIGNDETEDHLERLDQENLRNVDSPSEMYAELVDELHDIGRIFHRQMHPNVQDEFQEEVDVDLYGSSPVNQNDTGSQRSDDSYELVG